MYSYRSDDRPSFDFILTENCLSLFQVNVQRIKCHANKKKKKKK